MSATLTRQWHQSGSGPRPDDFADVLYLAEINLQCEFAHHSFGQMREVFAADPKHPSLLALAHMLLVFAGNVAKLLSATDKSSAKTKERAARLRQLLGIDESEFSEVRSARNYLEHFDERMDKFIGTTDGMLLHRLVTEELPSTVTLDDGRQFTPKYLQLLTTNNLQLILHGQSISLPAVLAQLEHIQAKVRNRLPEPDGQVAGGTP